MKKKRLRMRIDSLIKNRQQSNFIQRHGKLQCLICHVTIAFVKKYNVKQQYEKNHKNTTILKMTSGIRK